MSYQYVDKNPVFRRPIQQAQLDPVHEKPIPEGSKKKFAIGYYFENENDGRTKFMHLVRKYTPYLQEIYFPWPGLANAREQSGDVEEREKIIIQHLRECRSREIKLDMLANATCYGDDAVTPKQREHFLGILKKMDGLGILPEVLTTTSPYLAMLVKKNFPTVECRASVNMRLNSTLAVKYVSDYYDSFYICRDIQRDIPTLQEFQAWCKKNGKKMCMLVNSGCFRYCPWQTFHEMLLSHNYMNSLNESINVRMQPVLCANTIISQKKYEEILRCSWIRPEDLWQYEPYATVFKLSTREVPYPEVVLDAYVSRDYDGDLSKIIDPGFPQFIQPKIINNKSFPKEWSEGKIAGKCANNCTHCGKCTEVLKQVLIPDPARKKRPIYDFT